VSFTDRKRLHDYVLVEILPKEFAKLGISFTRRGIETLELSKNGLTISELEDSTSTTVRFTPDGVAILSNSFLVELKTILPEQKSNNYDFEMAPWEKGHQLYKLGNLVVYLFYPAMKCAYINDTKPDWIGVPKWRWTEQDYLRVKNRYETMCNVRHIDVEGGSGTIFGLIRENRIAAMKAFEIFWKEILGKWSTPKQLKLKA